MVVEYTEFRDCFWGQNGFEELKKYMRTGNDFCKDLASVLAERAENELNYAKSLNKTSLRLQKLAKDFHGNLSDAWLQVSMQFDIEAEMHKSLASALQEEIVKPIKILVENNIKSRKPIELKVEKVTKNFIDKKTEDYKYRSRCFQLVKDIEKAMYSLDEAQKGVAGKPPNVKEISKIETQIAKTKEQLDKSELKYHKACSSVELARQDWQYETIDACNQMQIIESDRLNQLEQFIKKISIQMNVLSKKMTKVVDVYENLEIDVEQDIRLACKKYGTGTIEPEMYLYDIYAENTKNMMNKDRRILNLNKWVELFNSDVQAQVKSRQGLEKVKIFSKENPNFNANNEADIEIKLESVRLLQTLYESSLFKVQYALAELLDTAKPSSNFSNKMTTTYDRQGVPTTILKLDESELRVRTSRASAPSPPTSPSNIITQMQMPMPMRMPIAYNFTNPYDTNNYVAESVISTTSSSSSTLSSVSPSPSIPSSSSSSLSNNNYNKRNSFLLTTTITSTTINNNNNSNNNHIINSSTSYQSSKVKNSESSNNYDSINNKLVENHYNNSNQSFSDDEDDDSDWEEEQIYKTVTKCLAQFDFKSTREDEISIQVGDEIEIIEKREDGWWRGKLNDKIGLFPSTYVTEQT